MKRDHGYMFVAEPPAKEWWAAINEKGEIEHVANRDRKELEGLTGLRIIKLREVIE